MRAACSCERELPACVCVSVYGCVHVCVLPARVRENCQPVCLCMGVCMYACLTCSCDRELPASVCVWVGGCVGACMYGCYLLV